MRLPFSLTKKNLVVLLVLAAAITGSLLWKDFWQSVASDPGTILLPYFIFRTLLRMSLAYAATVVFGLAYGIVAALYPKPRILMIPLLDIFQSIPLLGFLVPAFLFFQGNLPGEFGNELTAILLLFSSMAWAVTYNTYGAVRAVPDDIREAAASFGITGWRYIRHVVMPAIIPAFVTGSVTAVGGGWYFIVAVEFLTYGSSTIVLPGLGSYMTQAVNAGNLPASLFGLALLIGIVYSINQFLWRPLMAWSAQFKIQTFAYEEEEAEAASDQPVIRALTALLARREKLDRFIARLELTQRAVFRHIYRGIDSFVPRRSRRRFRLGRLTNLTAYTGLFVVLMTVAAVFIAAALQRPLIDLKAALDAHPESYRILEYTGASVFRIVAAYLLSLAWTLAAAILIYRSKELRELFFPLFDIGQSIPALALFPFLVLFVIRVLGGSSLGLELISIALVMTGTQWYLLFNILGAIRAIPGDVREASAAFGITGWRYIRTVMLPAIFPGIVLGSVQAWGGAWNALIVAEYINFSGQVYTVPGLGYLLDKATAEWASPSIVAVALSVMTAVILLVNYFVWKRAFDYAERFRFTVT